MNPILSTLLAFAALALPPASRAESAKPAEATKPTGKTDEPAKPGKFKWYTSITAARKAAAEEKKPIFVLFTGSDWCPYCVKLEKEILSKKEFKTWATDKAILFIADAKGGSSKLSPSNRKLMKEYGAKGFPSVFITNAEGKAFGETGYTGATPEKYCKILDGMIASVK